MNQAFHLEFRDLAVGRRQNLVVSGLSAVLRPGRMHLVLGRAGSGKTTLLATIAGFLEPLSGAMTSRGEPWNPSGRVGLAFQNPETMFFCATVGEEVTFALRERGEAGDSADKAGKDWLQSWGVDAEAFWQRNPFHLSGGEKRRVALAAATIFRPEVILLDEPLAGLDPRGAAVLRDRLRDLAREHLVIVVTHDPEELLRDSAQVVLLQSGSARVFSTASSFLRSALENPGIYPLPEWYTRALAGQLGDAAPPAPIPEEVAGFLASAHGACAEPGRDASVQERPASR